MGTGIAISPEKFLLVHNSLEEEAAIPEKGRW